MIHIRNIARWNFCLFALLGLASLSAQVSFTDTYTEDFNTLPFNTNYTDPFTFTNND